MGVIGARAPMLLSSGAVTFNPSIDPPWGDGPPPVALGLDLMDTLIRDPWREAVEGATGLTVEALRALIDRGAWSEFELGRLDERAWADRFFLQDSGLALDLERLKDAFRRGYRFVDGMEELLAAAAARMPVHILSNYPPWYEHVRRSFALDRFVTGHHPSYDVGARKPAPLYFERALQRAGLAPHELLFVDDVAENVAAARALGIPSVTFAGAADLRLRIAPLLDRRTS
jgi:HAD superfamily hydrolase (TIGR01509 family)